MSFRQRFLPEELIGKPGGYRRERSQVIYSEGYNPRNDTEKENKGPKYPKSQEQRGKLMGVVQDCFLFKSLDCEQKEHIINAMYERTFAQNELVFGEGDDGESFFVVERGIFDVFINGENIATYRNSGSFGELALMHNMPRSSTVKAISDGVLWTLDRRTFRKIVLREEFRRRKMYEDLIEKVPMLQELTSQERLSLADSFVPKVFKNEEIIYEKGDRGDGMYFVESGCVHVLLEDNIGVQYDRVVRKIESEGYFGELALVARKPRAFTVVAASDLVKCAFLDVDAFERLLGPCMEIMKRNIDTYQDQILEMFGTKSLIELRLN